MSIRLPRIPLPAFGPAHIVAAVALLLLVLFAYSTAQTMRSTYRLNEARSALQSEVHDLRRQQAQLEGLRRYLQSDEYIEAVAREHFGLVREGEIAVDVQAPAPAEPPRQPGQRWWEAVFDP